MRSWILLMVLLTMCYDSTQCQNIGGDHYLVEFEEFTPPTQDMIDALEGFPSTPFLAPDTKGNDYLLSDFHGQNVLLFFWNLECSKCLKQLDILNQLQSEFSGKLQIIGLADNSKAEMLKFEKSKSLLFPVLFSTKTLGDGPYAGELGYPRLFLIDEYGIINKVLPGELFDHNVDLYKILEKLLTEKK